MYNTPPEYLKKHNCVKTGGLIIKDALLLFIVALLIIMNYAYMHYEVYLSHAEISISTLFHSLVFMILDAMIPLLVLTIVMRRGIGWASILAYLVGLILVLSNIIYSRYFGQYITWDVLGQIKNFEGSWWHGYLTDLFRLSDLFLLVTTGLFFLFLYNFFHYRLHMSYTLLSNLLLIIFLFFLFINTRFDRILYAKDSKFYGRSYFDHFLQQVLLDRTSLTFIYGLTNTQFVYPLFLPRNNILKLNNNDIREINQYIHSKHSSPFITNDSCLVQGTPNILFIIVESYNSLATESFINGSPITPNLHAIKSDSDVYYNPLVKSNRGKGASSDAQVSYFTGLLPLQSELSINYVKRNKLIALPALLRDQKGYNTYITLPTLSTFWDQNLVNKTYGIDKSFSVGDWVHDDELFHYIVNNESNMVAPYFHVVLTASMHGPYNNNNLDDITFPRVFQYPSNYSVDYCNYLDRCYFTDKQIGYYLEHLRVTGQYDNTLIVIMSDHEGYIAKGITANTFSAEALPLFIINSHIDSSKFRHGTINQIDLFPTILDMFGLSSVWRGVGNSLLRCESEENSINKAYMFSQKILMGNYFQEKGNICCR